VSYQLCKFVSSVILIDYFCFIRKKGGNPDEPVCIALSSDEEEVEEESSSNSATMLAEDGTEIKLDSNGEYR
jgi:hypothetical protein